MIAQVSLWMPSLNGNKLFPFPFFVYPEQTAITIERLSGSQHNGNHEGEHGRNYRDNHYHDLVLNGYVRRTPSQYLPYHGSG